MHFVAILGVATTVIKQLTGKIPASLRVTRPCKLKRTLMTSRLPILTIRVYNSELEGVLGSRGFDAEAIHGGVSSG